MLQLTSFQPWQQTCQIAEIKLFYMAYQQQHSQSHHKLPPIRLQCHE